MNANETHYQANADEAKRAGLRPDQRQIIVRWETIPGRETDDEGQPVVDEIVALQVPPTRYVDVVKLQGAPGNVGSVPRAYTTSPGKEIVMPLQYRRCRWCLAEKPLDDFHRDKNFKDGRKLVCKACRLAYIKRPDQRAKHSEAAKRYATTRPDLVREWRAAHYSINADKARAESRLWHAAHREQALARMAAYARAYPEVHRANHRKRRARKASAPICDLTRSQWDAIKVVFGHRCVYCGIRPKRLTQDHIIPLSRGGSHTAANVVPACGPCNSKKHAGPPLTPIQGVLLV